MIFDATDAFVPIFESLIVFLPFLVPLSFALAIYFVWSSYLKQKYRKMCIFSFLPILTLLGTIITSCIIHDLNKFLLYH